MRGIVLGNPSQQTDRDIKCCYASLGLCIMGGMKWTPERAINYIFAEYTLPQERISEVEALEIDQMRQRDIPWSAIGELFGISLKTAFNAHKRFMGGGS